MSEPVEYFTACTKNGGTFEGKTLDLLLAAIAMYYFEPHDEDLQIEQMVGVTLHVDDTEVPFPAKVVSDLNDQIERRVKLIQAEYRHEMDHQRQESTGRL